MFAYCILVEVSGVHAVVISGNTNTTIIVGLPNLFLVLLLFRLYVKTREINVEHIQITDEEAET